MKEELYPGTIILLATTVIPFSNDLFFYLGVGIPVCLGMVLRIGLQLSNEETRKKMTWLSFSIQLMITIPVCFVSYHFWVSYKLIDSLSIFMFMVALMALYIGSLIDKLSKNTIKEVLQMIFRKLLSDNEKEEIK